MDRRNDYLFEVRANWAEGAPRARLRVEIRILTVGSSGIFRSTDGDYGGLLDQRVNCEP